MLGYSICEACCVLSTVRIFPQRACHNFTHFSFPMTIPTSYYFLMEVDLVLELSSGRQMKTETAHGDYATPRGWELLYGERVQDVASQGVSTLTG